MAYYRFEVDNLGIYEAVEKFCSKQDSRRLKKPDGSWLTKAGEKFPGAVSFWTEVGLHQYVNSGLQDWHCSVIKGKVKILVLNSCPQNILYRDQHQVIFSAENLPKIQDLSLEEFKIYYYGNKIPQRSFSGSPWEQKVNYCRSLRVGNLAVSSGTVSIDAHGDVVGKDNPYLQASQCLKIIEESFQKLGFKRSNIIRTRMFVTNIQYFEEFSRAHHDFFLDHPPVTSMVEVKALVRPEFLIEIEAEAHG